MRVAIIGAGAAGMMCAATLQERNPSAEIFLIDRNDGMGKKVIISGGGRCNVTTGIHDVKTVLKKYPRGEKFLTSAMYAFPPESVYDWFELNGVPLKTQEDERVFPISNDGKDIVRVFEKKFENSNVKVLLKTPVTSIEKRGNEFLVHFKDAALPLAVDTLVLTTGGQAYRQTGSTGDGYAFAQLLGHTITPLAPSLNAFFTKETWPARISGLSLPSAKITAKCEKQSAFIGPMLFTHKGISGPAVFALSSLVAFETYHQEQPLNITIDLFPEESFDSLHADLTELVRLHPHKLFENILCKGIPSKLAEIALEEMGIPRTKIAQEIRKKEGNRMCHWMKNIPLAVIQRGAGDEFVTAGGVALSEVDPRTMESKICPGLFFAGEILDVDGFTGGFNLQASWATGRLAGSSMGESR